MTATTAPTLLLAPQRSSTALLLAAAGDPLPSAVAVDVGRIQDPDTGQERWAVVEADMPWFAHSYAAAPGAVLDVVLRAAGPRAAVAPSDQRFVREAVSPYEVRQTRGRPADFRIRSSAGTPSA